MNDTRCIFGWLVRLLRVLQFLAIFPLQEACETSQCLRLYSQILIRQLIFMPLIGYLCLLVTRLIPCSSAHRRASNVRPTWRASLFFWRTQCDSIPIRTIFEPNLNELGANLSLVVSNLKFELSWLKLNRDICGKILQVCWDFDDSGGKLNPF